MKNCEGLVVVYGEGGDSHIEACKNEARAWIDSVARALCSDCMLRTVSEIVSVS